MKNTIYVRKCRKMNPSEISIVVLSDDDSDAEDSKVQIIDDSEVEVVTLDDSNVNSSIDTFTIDTTPDFIPVRKVLYNKPTRGRKRRLGASPSLLVSKRKCLPELMTSELMVVAHKSGTKHLPELMAAECGQTLNRKVQNTKTVAGKSKIAKKQITRKTVAKLKKSENVAIKPKIPQIHLSHTNIHNTAATTHSAGELRPIVIDGCNVAFGFGNGTFQIEGIILVVDYFKNRGHKEIVCFLPQCYRNKHRPADVSQQIQKLEKEDIITYTPSRKLNGQLIKPYDDRFVVQYASEREGVIISNDGYLDLIEEEPSWRITIEKRIINFTFARGLLMFAKDPLGPNGPTLDEMLRFPLT